MATALEHLEKITTIGSFPAVTRLMHRIAARAGDRYQHSVTSRVIHGDNAIAAIDVAQLMVEGFRALASGSEMAGDVETAGICRRAQDLDASRSDLEAALDRFAAALQAIGGGGVMTPTGPSVALEAELAGVDLDD